MKSSEHISGSSRTGSTLNVILCVAGLAGLASSPLPAAPYKPTWESLATAPVPQWWDEGKFGIFIHWGPYSVAGYKDRNRGYAEAITSDLYNKPDRYVEFMTKKFGAAPPDFGYKDMVPLFKAERWDPAAWAKLFKAAGAMYVIPTGEHHDGFVLWDSKLTPWTATRKGPHRDLIGELGEAVRAEGLKYGISYHRERHPGRFAPEQVVHGRPHDQIAEEIRRLPEAASLYGPFEYSDEFIADYVARWKEAERQYRPDFLWIDDVPINTAQGWGKAVYFNNKGKTANWPVGVGCLEADNLQMETIGPRWQNPATLGTSYAYMAAEEKDDLYKTPTELVRLLCDVVSKNGNLLLNIGPRADGTIPEGMQRRLLALGDWLKVNGEAIYGSQPWTTYGEHAGDLIREDNVIYTKHSMRVHETEFRYTRKPGVVYVIAFQPLNADTNLKAFVDFENTITDVTRLDSGERIDWELSDGGLELKPTGSSDFQHANVFKVFYVQ
jgi:alpha-L-fucosidase